MKKYTIIIVLFILVFNNVNAQKLRFGSSMQLVQAPRMYLVTFDKEIISLPEYNDLIKLKNNPQFQMDYLSAINIRPALGVDFSYRHFSIKSEIIFIPWQSTKISATSLNNSSLKFVNWGTYLEFPISVSYNFYVSSFRNFFIEAGIRYTTVIDEDTNYFISDYVYPGPYSSYLFGLGIRNIDSILHFRYLQRSNNLHPDVTISYFEISLFNFF